MKPVALLTNDDGINAAFLHALVAACVTEGFDVVVAAPSGERSWIGRAFSRHREVTLADYPNLGRQAWSIDGTPSDCVNIALGHLMPVKPAVVLSGINIGFNATMPLCLSSGTLAGATEGTSWGLPAVACSLDLEQSLFEQVHRNSSVCPPALRPHLEAAGRHAARFAKGLVGHPAIACTCIASTTRRMSPTAPRWNEARRRWSAMVPSSSVRRRASCSPGTMART
jgi:5'-nucleotidase